MEISFRDVVTSIDRNTVRSIVERTGFFRSDEVDIAVELVDERLSRGEASGYRFLFAELGSEVAGYACFGEIACTIGSFDLFWIAVDPQFQRRGVGQKLLREVETRITAVDGRRIYIDTSGKHQYEPTRSFYEAGGFRCEARLSDFYAPGDDRVIYSKTVERL